MDSHLLSKIGLSDLSKIVFSEAITRGETTVIPVAKLKYGFGFGVGKTNHLSNKGEGGGGGGMVSPIGFIEINNGKAKFKPIRHARSLISIATSAVLVSLVLIRLSQKIINK